MKRINPEEIVAFYKNTDWKPMKTDFINFSQKTACIGGVLILKSFTSKDSEKEFRRAPYDENLAHMGDARLKLEELLESRGYWMGISTANDNTGDTAEEAWKNMFQAMTRGFGDRTPKASTLEFIAGINKDEFLQGHEDGLKVMEMLRSDDQLKLSF